jgi:alanine racemase
MAVVKANAYGHGAVELARVVLANGADHLAVARVDEGFELRKAGIDAPLLVFELVPKDMYEKALQAGLQLTLSTTEGAAALNEVAGKLRVKAGVHLKVDTGMTRLGLDYRVAAAQMETILRLRWLDVRGVYSHFATAEDPDQTFALLQLERFNLVLDELNRRGLGIPLRHMAGSSAIMALPGSHFDMVRPGIMLYGYPPRRGMDARHPLKPVMSLVSAVSLVKNVAADTSVSYSRRYFTRRETRIATVPIGYADGYSRLLTGKSSLMIRGKRYPVVGTVCMDHIMADVGMDDVHEGDNVTLIGRDGEERITAWDLAALIGTIPYEVLCLVTDRVPRVMT